MVHKLDADAFILTNSGDAVMRNKTGMIGYLLIFTNWCNFCTRFKPEYIKLDYVLNDNGLTFPLFAIDDKAMEKNPKVGQGLKFSGYPTIKVVKRDGTLVDYEGERDASKMAAHIKSQR
jgi:thiol-disulfide isomerase/thioredoxin